MTRTPARTPPWWVALTLAGFLVLGTGPGPGASDLAGLARAIDGGRYADAEARARATIPQLDTLPSIVRARAQALCVDALIADGRGGEPGTLALARTLPDGSARERRIGRVLLENGAFADAVAAFERATALDSPHAAAAPLDLADDLEGLARALVWLERYERAQPTIDRAISLYARAAEPARPGLARALATRAVLRQRTANLAGARDDLTQALRLRDAVAARHPATASVLVVYGDVLRTDGSRAESRRILEQAVALARETLRPGHPEIAVALRTLAIPLTEDGEIEAGRALVADAMRLAEAAHGGDHPLVGIQANDLADSLSRLGEYAEARRLQKRALTIYERRLGSGHSYTATALLNLALLNHLIGDYQEAARLHRRAIATWERRVGPDHPWVAWGVAGLGDALASQNRHRQALPLFERALAIRRRHLGPDNALVADVLTKLARCLASLGGRERARGRTMAAEALAAWERSNTREGAAEAWLVKARLELDADAAAPAREAAARALDIRRSLFGDRHPAVGEAQAVLAEALAADGNVERAFEVALTAERIGREHLRLTTTYLPERQALGYAQSRPRGLDLALSVQPADGAGQAFEELVRSRAIVLDAMATRQRPVDTVDTPDITLAWTTLAAASRRLANLAVRGPGDLSAGQYREVMLHAQQAKDEAEVALAERSTRFGVELARRNVGAAHVLAALPSNGGLVSYVRHRRPRPAGGVTGGGAAGAAYSAFVLRSGATAPAVVALGDAAGIDEAIDRWRREVAGRQRTGLPDRGDEIAVRRLGAALRARIWDPVATHLGGVERVFIVPDGALNLVAFAALPADDGRYVVETGPTVHYLSAERDLVVEPQPRVGKGLLAFGGPGYGALAAGPAGAPPATTRRSSCGTFESIGFLPLPAARQEAEEILALWRSLGANGDIDRSEVRTGARASESAFKHSGPGRRVLHLATHGFFLDEKCEEKRYGGRGIGRLNPGTPSAPRRRVMPDNPLLLSGLALAGANRRFAAKPTDEDGILTAVEVAALDLDGVEWAVLSACNTGIGEIKVGEGVFGLRRAFQVAGARTTIMSLWDVEDGAARAWMRPLYEGRLRDKLSTAEAVRHASLVVLRDRRAKGLNTHPFYWAGFVAAGDWR